MIELSLLEQKAKEFAIKYHKDQKYDDKPYIFHLEQVRNILIDAGIRDENLLCAAWLHDLLEDTDCSSEDFGTEFNDQIFDMVFAVTGKGKNRKEKMQSIYDQCHGNPNFINLKLADRIANIEYSKIHNQKLFEMYRREMEGFWDNFVPIGDNILWQRLERAATPFNKMLNPDQWYFVDDLLNIFNVNNFELGKILLNNQSKFEAKIEVHKHGKIFEFSNFCEVPNKIDLAPVLLEDIKFFVKRKIEKNL